MKRSELRKIIKEELNKLLLENVVCDTINNNPYTGVSSTCPAVAGQGSQTCTANFPGNGHTGTCGPASVAPGGGTPTGGGPIGVDNLDRGPRTPTTSKPLPTNPTRRKGGIDPTPTYPYPTPNKPR